MSGNNLFDDEGDGDEIAFKVNEDYASQYNYFRGKQELQSLKDRYGDGDYESSSSSSDDEFCEPENPKFDQEFLRTLATLESKASTSQDQRFFADSYGHQKKGKKEKPMNISAYQRHVMLETGGTYEEDEKYGRKSFLPDDEKQKILESMKEAENANDSDGEDDLFSSGLFKAKENSKTESQSNAKDDVLQFIKGKKGTLSKKEDEDMYKTLRKKWQDPKLSEKEKWLADFFLNERYLDEDDETIERAYNHTAIDEETLSEDEMRLEVANEFERRYNFRFEEPDQQFIKQYPRDIQSSVRTKDTRRKKARELYEERKKREKEQKRQEIERLKALKYQEIMEKIEKIKVASGNEELNLGDNDLNGDFDPAAHDAKMSNMFGDNYYGVCDEEKPVFSDDDDIYQDYDELLDKEREAGGQQKGNTEEEYVDYENFNMDADYDPNQAGETSWGAPKRSRNRKRSKFMQILDKKKPVFDPEHGNFDSYFEEYYNLDFEDIVGGMPCRYRYRKVEPNSFGLSTEEILAASSDDLQKWVKLQKIIRYNRTHEEEERDMYHFNKLGKKDVNKQTILPSLFAQDPSEALLAEEDKKRKKNLKKKLRKQKRLQEQEMERIKGRKHSGMTDTRKAKKVAEESSKEEKEMEKSDVVDENSALSGTEEVLEEAEENMEKTEAKKKKKKKKKETEEEGKSPETDAAIETSELPDIGETKNKKKRKDADTDAGTESPAKKKKKRKDADTDAGTESPAKKKKKKDKHAEKRPEQKKNKYEKDGNFSSLKEPKIPMQNKKFNKKKKTKDQDNGHFSGVSDERLAAYGENPKKLKNFVKYGKNAVGK